MPSVCVHCGCTNFISDKQTGGLICTNCGAVAEDGRIVSELQFDEGPSGKTRLVGSFISDMSLNIGAYKGENGENNNNKGGGFEMSSFERSVRKTKILMEGLAGRLRIPGYFVEQAIRIYMLALQKSMTKGVRSEVTAAACLYITTRVEKTPHILLDFSDAIGVNSAEIGSTYLKISKLLRKEDIAMEDPQILIPRFVHLLSLPNSVIPNVTKVAQRVITLMDKAWLTVGRPALGIVGAALFIGCRSVNNPKTLNEISRSVHVSTRTIQKRLDELKESDVGPMKVGTLLGNEGVLKEMVSIIENRPKLPSHLQRTEELQTSIKNMMKRMEEGEKIRERLREEKHRREEKEKEKDMNGDIDGKKSNIKHISGIIIPTMEELNLTDTDLFPFLCTAEETSLRIELWKISSKEAYAKAKATESIRLASSKKKELSLPSNTAPETAYDITGEKVQTQSDVETDDELMQFLSVGSDMEFSDFHTSIATLPSATTLSPSKRQTDETTRKKQQQENEDEQLEHTSESEQQAFEMELFTNV